MKVLEGVPAAALAAVAVLPLVGAANARIAPAAPVAEAGGPQAMSGSRWMSDDHGCLRTGGHNSGVVGKWDHVALSDHYPTNPGNYLSGAWQWVTSGDHTTGYRATGSAYYCASIAWDAATGAHRNTGRGGPHHG
ncbi:hypothetical protein [Streptomyces jumonjinensis]|uniref:hypothetical protein n=1 Tax=Streptomyces jumonjinensis TaxID=1945 RepID=UPI0037A6D8A3